MHYYQFNIGDYTSHTQHLEPLEDIAYRRMIDWCYLHEKPLPADHQEIAKKIRMRTHCECIADVLLEFFELTEDGYICHRVVSEVNQFRAKSEKAKASANARWNKKPNKKEKVIKEKKADANALRPDCEGNAKHKPLTTKQEPLNNIPEWINQESWKEFINIRKKLKAVNSDIALKKILNKLKTYKDLGYNPNEIIDSSITAGWKDVYQPKTPPTNNISSSTAKPLVSEY